MLPSRFVIQLQQQLQGFTQNKNRKSIKPMTIKKEKDT